MHKDGMQARAIAAMHIGTTAPRPSRNDKNRMTRHDLIAGCSRVKVHQAKKDEEVTPCPDG
jgi:hypothetical protein